MTEVQNLDVGSYFTWFAKKGGGGLQPPLYHQVDESTGGRRGRGIPDAE